MIKNRSFKSFEKLVSKEDAFSFWYTPTKSNHDIEYEFENISETQTKVTPIYKNSQIVGEPTYETRTEEGNRSEYAFRTHYDYYEGYCRPAIMCPSGRPLVANEFNYDDFTSEEGYPDRYYFWGRKSEISDVSYKFLLMYWIENMEEEEN